MSRPVVLLSLAVVCSGYACVEALQLRRGLGAACDTATPCEGGLLCAIGRCRQPCAGDGECEYSCVAAEGQFVCTTAEEAGCGERGCPRGLSCAADDLCRTPCTDTCALATMACVGGTCTGSGATGGGGTGGGGGGNNGGGKPAGKVCESAAECASGYCADGYCCDRVCDGPCEHCDDPASRGLCVPVGPFAFDEPQFPQAVVPTIATQAQFPTTVAADETGLLFTDSNGALYRVQNGTTSPVCPDPVGLTDPHGILSLSGASPPVILVVVGDDTLLRRRSLASCQSQLECMGNSLQAKLPGGLGVDTRGDVYVVDDSSDQVFVMTYPDCIPKTSLQLAEGVYVGLALANGRLMVLDDQGQPDKVKVVRIVADEIYPSATWDVVSGTLRGLAYDGAHVYLGDQTSHVIRRFCPQPGVFAHWTFNEPQGEHAVDSGQPGGQRYAKLESGVQRGEAMDGSVIFDGKGAYVSTVGTGDHLPRFTVEVWAMLLEKTPAAAAHSLVVKRAVGDATAPANFRLAVAGDKAIFELGDGFGNTLQVLGVVSQPTQWHHYAASYDGGDLALYVDAQLAGTLAPPGSPAMAQDQVVTIGGGPNTKLGEALRGVVGDVIVYDHARTVEQITRSYQVGKALAGK